MSIRYITVHGTGDSVADADDPKWWQPESEFSRNLLARAGGGKIEPFIWDGKNDELSRREAAERLLFKLAEYDSRGKEVVLIGHSHGGSVIATALTLAMSTERTYENINSVISIGTPFIHMKPQRWFWERLDFSGQLALLYSTFLFFMMLAAIATLVVFGWFNDDMSAAQQRMQEARDTEAYTDSMFQADAMVADFGVDATTAIATIASSLLIIGLAWYILVRSQRRLRQLHNKDILAKFHDTFSGRWLALYDKRDEAINGLRRVFDLRLNLMETGQFRGALRFILVLITGFMLGSAVVADELYSAINIAQFLSGQEVAAGGDLAETRTPLQLFLKDYAENSLAANIHLSLVYDLAEPIAFEALLWYNIHVAPNLEFLPRFIDATAYDNMGQPTVVMVFLIDVISVIFKLLIVIAVFPLSDILNRLVFGRFFAGSLNSAFNNQVKRQALGNTTKGEDLVGVDRVPKGWTQQAVPLSETASEALCEYAASHARETLIKVQDVLGDESIHTDHTLVDELTEQLSWRELIHTAYFRVPESQAFIIDEVITKAGLTPRPAASKLKVENQAPGLTETLASAEARATVEQAVIPTRSHQNDLPPASPEYPVLRRPAALQP